MNRQFCGVYDALDVLENEWPMHGKHQAQAVRACRAALRHPRYADWARNSFIAACIEASFACSDMPGGARPPRPNLRQPTADWGWIVEAGSRGGDLFSQGVRSGARPLR
ncbi:DUF982 domain-containing protein [Sinorhizobium meliloti]|uniref:DUF982 domain-containing protein n=1 Tax=Rhizobium meliloti TaxID=382 RepID=UPI001F43A32E|nr:DUF982 domain-containing protein [Sinorhizobium meliloti]